MSINNLQFGIKLTLDNREVVGSLEVSRQQLRSFSAALKNSAATGASAFSATSKVLQSLSTQFAELRTAALAYFSVMKAAEGARAIVDSADAMRGLSARLKIATADAADYARALKGVFAIANRYGASVEETGRTFARLNPVIQQLGGSSEQTLQMIDGLAASLKLSGATAAETSAVLLQFSQAMGSGIVGGDEFRALMEEAEPLMRAVAQQLGKTTGELRQMSEQGQLTSTVFGNALLQSIDRVRKQAADIPNGFSQSMQILRNELTRAFGREFEQQSSGLSRAIQGMAEHADMAARAVRVLSDAVLELGKVAAEVFAGAAIGGFIVAVSRASKAVAALRTGLAGVNSVLLLLVGGAVMQKLEKLSRIGRGGLLGLVFFGVYEITDWLINLMHLRNKIAQVLDPVFRAMDRLLGIDHNEHAQDPFPATTGKTSATPKRLTDPATFGRLTQNLDYESKLIAKHKQELTQLEQAYQDRLATIKDAAARRAFEKEYRQARQELLIRQRNELKNLGSRKAAEAAATELAAQSQARVEAARATGEAELAILKQGLERAKVELDAALEDRLVSIRDYYAKKSAIEQREIEGEIAQTRSLLAEQQNVVASGHTEAERIKARGQVAKLEGELMALNNKRAAVEQDNARAAAKAERELADALADARLQLAKSTGTASDADRREAIARSYRDLRLRLLAESDAEGVSIIDRLIDVEAARQNLQALQDLWQRALESMGNAEQSVNIQQSQGLITSREAQDRIAAAHREAAAALDGLLPKMEAAAQAIGPDAVARVQAWKNELASVKDVVDPVAASINTTVKDAFTSLFENIGTGAKTARDAFLDFARSVLAAINRIAAQKLAEQLFGSMNKAGGGLGGLLSGFFRLAGFAAGGYVSGPGTSSSDSIPARLSAGEYVVRAEAVRRVGVGMLDAINGLRLPPVLQAGRLAFAAGGLVPRVPTDRPQAQSVRIVNVVDPSLAGEYLNSAAGERTVLNVLSRNAGVVKTILAGA
ncbi:MAG: tape measure protein [Acidithiobacillus sp.]|uniref:tape measure protein n=1 Tax=Acidithiobacillus sp. TaxID=1872118 RepID=UPI00258D4D95|nr:tape measure protein [Acidithiobacillus sp.]MCE5420253.1 tape measure protein [Acidithiobacillus sp.]